jgi:23S rRNA (cytosine1962-C5)-methyltransferase
VTRRRDPHGRSEARPRNDRDARAPAGRDARGPSVQLRKDVRFAIDAGHPWIWRDALAPHDHAPGTDVRVVDREGRFVARALVESGPIGARVLARRDRPIDAVLIRERVQSALSLRARIAPAETNAYRLIHGEGDGLPGVVCDRYDAHLVVKVDGAAAERLVPMVVDALGGALPDVAILVRRGRGDEKRTEAARGALPSGSIDVREHGMLLRADLVHGQKTGLFLDHRESRLRARQLARGARVLNLYGYVGGFSIAAGLGGAAHVTTVDVAEGALALAREGWERNGLDPSKHDALCGDVPKVLEQLRAEERRFELVISDPPSFAPNEASVPEAVRSYRALHRSCLRLLAPGALYLAASCSSHVGRELFDRTLLEASEKVGMVLQILERWSAPADHPRLAAFPEGDYLKCTLARVLA